VVDEFDVKIGEVKFADSKVCWWGCYWTAEQHFGCWECFCSYGCCGARNIKRFSGEKGVRRYCGIVPYFWQSGKTHYQELHKKEGIG